MKSIVTTVHVSHHSKQRHSYFGHHRILEGGEEQDVLIASQFRGTITISNILQKNLQYFGFADLEERFF